MFCSRTAIFFLLATAALAFGSERVIYSFNGGSDGAHPQAPLIADAGGNLYGAALEGGDASCSAGCGTVFQLAPPATRGGAWTKTTLYQFKGADGAGPEAGLILDKAGNLYGTTVSGGALGDGTVFELSPPTISGGAWTQTVLYSFKGGSDGSYPRSSVVFDALGNLYGETFFGGGSQNAGTVFQLVPPGTPGGTWTENVLHRFGSPDDGAQPISSLLIDQRGALYGTAALRYSSGGGAFFKLTPPTPGHTRWTETLLYVFNDQTDGDWPGDLILDRSGHLYGTNNLGGKKNCGTVFELIAPAQGGSWSATALHTFTGGDDGNLPTLRLAEDRQGNLYGTTTAGSNGSHDTVFKLTRPGSGGEWTKTILYQFTGGRDGSDPEGGVVFGKFGLLYGTAYSGGASGNGAIYAVAP